MKRPRSLPVEDAEPEAADGAPLLSIFLSARQQADLHLAPFDVEGEALAADPVADDRAD